MCWSAQADVTAGAVVLGLGLVGVAHTHRRQDLLLAALPIVLGVHQLIEADVWHALDERGVASGPAVTAWALIAFPLLPVLTPLSVLSAGPSRRRTLPFAAVGVATGAVLLAGLLSGTPSARQRGHVLDYAVGVPAAPLVIAGYLVATVGACPASADRGIRLLGAALAVGAAAAVAVDMVAFASVWCAFAALVSVVITARARQLSAPAVRANGGRWPQGHHPTAA